MAVSDKHTPSPYTHASNDNLGVKHMYLYLYRENSTLYQPGYFSIDDRSQAMTSLSCIYTDCIILSIVKKVANLLTFTLFVYHADTNIEYR